MQGKRVIFIFYTFVGIACISGSKIRAMKFVEGEPSFNFIYGIVEEETRGWEFCIILKFPHFNNKKI